MKYSEAEKKIKELSSEYSVEIDDKNFYVVYHEPFRIAHVNRNQQYGMHANILFLDAPDNNELFMILVHLASTPLDKRVDEKKYYIKIFDGPLGF